MLSLVCNSVYLVGNNRNPILPTSAMKSAYSSQKTSTGEGDEIIMTERCFSRYRYCGKITRDPRGFSSLNFHGQIEKIIIN